MIVTILDQLIESLRTDISNREDEYKDITVKKQYDELPKPKYPLIVVEEIQNNSVESRATSKGERTTALGYQFTAYSRGTNEHNASESVKFMLDIIDDTLQPPNYNMARVGAPAIIPYINDSTLMTGKSRYTCVYDYETNLLYRS